MKRLKVKLRGLQTEGIPPALSPLPMTCQSCATKDGALKAAHAMVMKYPEILGMNIVRLRIEAALAEGKPSPPETCMNPPEHGTVRGCCELHTRLDASAFGRVLASLPKLTGETCPPSPVPGQTEAQKTEQRAYFSTIGDPEHVERTCRKRVNPRAVGGFRFCGKPLPCPDHPETGR